MTITITSLKLKSVWNFFRLSLYGLKISQQAKTEKGFIIMKNTGFGYLHYTLSCWKSDEDAKRFARTGAHQEAMKKSSSIASEIKVYSFTGDQMPDWTEAKKLLHEKGKVFIF